MHDHLQNVPIQTVDRRVVAMVLVCFFSLFASVPAAQKSKQNKATIDSVDNSKFEYKKLGEYKFQLTYVITALQTNLGRVTATAVIPMAWPEQKVELISETKPKSMVITENRIAGQAAQITMYVPFIPGGGSAELVRVYKITRFRSKFLGDRKKLQPPKRITVPLRPFVGSAPGVEIKDRAVVKLAKEIFKVDNDTWSQLHSLHGWIRSNIKYEQGQYRGARATLKDRIGDCEDQTAIFVAVCRNVRIPARTVWVEGHAYPEFYLEETDGNKGHWIPAQLVGPNHFGEVEEHRPILQKGDRFYDSIRRRYMHYVPHSVRAAGGLPILKFTREHVDDENAK